MVDGGGWANPVTIVSNGMAGGADLILPSERCQWSVHCLGDTNTCGHRFDLVCPLGQIFLGKLEPRCTLKQLF